MTLSLRIASECDGNGAAQEGVAQMPNLAHGGGVFYGCLEWRD